MAKKSRFEVPLGDYMSHLLDLDGNTCHRMHVTRKFLLPFEKHIKYLRNDLDNDFKFSPDYRDT